MSAPDLSRWSLAAAFVSNGLPAWDAPHLAGLGGAQAARMASRWAGAWLDVLDGVDGARVLLIQSSPSRAVEVLVDRAGTVGVPDSGDGRSEFVEAWVGSRPGVLVAPGGELVAGGQWDLVMLDGTAGQPAPRMEAVAEGLAPGGRLVVVADNRLSPLRALDLLAGRAAGTPVPSLPGLARSLEQAGLAVRQRFGLLRSSVEPVVAFDADAPVAASAILRAGAVRTEGVRAVALQVAANGAAASRLLPVAPAWLVVSSRRSERWEQAADRPTGRIGYADSEESKVVRGEPPQALEKTYNSDTSRERELTALEVLAAAGVEVVPRVIGKVMKGRCRQTWLSGTPLVVGRLDAAALRHWVAEGARVLGRLHASTERPGGEVLVHGDYWLGNLLVDGGAVVGVIDWTESHWGDPGEDLEHLVSTLTTHSEAGPLEDIRALAGAEYGTARHAH